MGAQLRCYAAFLVGCCARRMTSGAGPRKLGGRDSVVVVRGGSCRMKVSAPIIAFTGTLLAAVLLGACGGNSAPASTAPTGDAAVAANAAPASKPVAATGANSVAGTSDRLTSTSATLQASQN